MGRLCLCLTLPGASARPSSVKGVEQDMGKSGAGIPFFSTNGSQLIYRIMTHVSTPTIGSEPLLCPAGSLGRHLASSRDEIRS